MSVPALPAIGRRVLAQAPVVLVVAGLAALGIWGMSHDWRLPLSGRDEDKKDESWCDAHNVPKDICVECRPELMARGEPFGWCRIHGVHECPLCHPEVAQVDNPYPVSEEDRARAKAALDFAPRPDNGRKDKLHERRIQFASLAAYDRSGVEVSPAYQGKISETAAVHGEITHD